MIGVALTREHWILVVLTPTAALLSVVIWLNWRILRKKRREYTEHPKRIPYGRAFAGRVSPFLALTAASAVYGMVKSEAELIVYGMIGVACFGVRSGSDGPHPPAPADRCVNTAAGR